MRKPVIVTDDLEFPGGTLTPTRVERDRYEYQWRVGAEVGQRLYGVGRSFQVGVNVSR